MAGHAKSPARGAASVTGAPRLSGGPPPGTTLRLGPAAARSGGASGRGARRPYEPEGADGGEPEWTPSSPQGRACGHALDIAGPWTAAAGGSTAAGSSGQPSPAATPEGSGRWLAEVTAAAGGLLGARDAELLAETELIRAVPASSSWSPARAGDSTLSGELAQASGGGSSASGAGRAPGRAAAAGRAGSPPRRAATSLSDAGTPGGAPFDPVHEALLRLADIYPLVHHFQRINRGFYRLEGHGSCELSLARNSDKLLVQFDGWNRGVRGELCKFLQSAGDLPRPAPTPTPASRGGRQPSEGSGVHQGPGPRGVGSYAFSPLQRRSGGPQARSPPPSAAQAVGRRSPASSAGGARRQPGGKPPGSSKAAAGAAAAAAAAAKTAELMARFREGTIFVHSSEPLFGELVVLLRSADARPEAWGKEAEGRLPARLLCSGRTAEVPLGALSPLELWPQQGTSCAAALAAFEELFFAGCVEERAEAQQEVVFGCVELEELTPERLAQCMAACWPAGHLEPARGLVWALRPFLVDWLQRRQRLRLLGHLAVALPDEALRRCGATEALGASGPALRELLLGITERDLMVVTLLSTPAAQRSRLYAFAAETAAPLPLAFPSAGVPSSPGSPSDAHQDVCEGLDQGVCVHWGPFEALMARPSRPLLLSLGAVGCAQAGKSTLLKELLGLEAACVDVPLPRGHAQQHSSPMHSPGVDLLRSAAPLGWTADVHGCALGDPTWMALMATLMAAASLIVLHVSHTDFAPTEAAAPQPAAATPPAASAGGGGGGPPQRRPSLGPQQQQLRRASARAPPGPPPQARPQTPPPPAAESAAADLRPARLTARPDLLALVHMAARCRLPALGAGTPRVLAVLRDASPADQQQSALLSSVRLCLENVLGDALIDVCPLVRLEGLAGSHRQFALSSVRSQLQGETQALQGSGYPTPCVAALKDAFSHFYDRLTLAGERPVLPPSDHSLPPGAGSSLAALLVHAEALAGGQLLAHAFPVSESAARLARLKAKERHMLDDESVDDARVAELAAQLRVLEKDRRALLQQPLSAPVRFVADALLAEPRLRHAQVADLSQHLAAWREPRLQPLLQRRRALLDQRLQLGHGLKGGSPEAAGAERAQELAAVSGQLAATEHALEQLNITLDTFWEEIAAVSDLCMEAQAAGARPPLSLLPDLQGLRRCYAEWAWELNQPVQLLHGSPLRCAGQFLVDILKDLGAEHPSELFVISVIGVQSSAKSTLLNYLFGCGFATSAGRCTRGLYCSLAEAQGKTLLILDTEGLMSLEAEGGDVFDAQLALMAMACSHLVLINHKGELSRQLQDLLEVCLFAMQHLKVCRIQPRLLFVLRDQHDRSHEVHGDALRLMRKHLAEASGHLSLRLEDLISLDPDSVFLLPSAFASDLDPFTGREVRWSTDLFAREALRLRRLLFGGGNTITLGGLGGGAAACGEDAAGAEAAPEFSTLPDWCLHAMSVWRVLDRYGPNLLHYKSIQEIELQRELEDMVKQISTQTVHAGGGFVEHSRALLAGCTQRLQEEPSEQVDSEFRSSLQALLEQGARRAQAELERILQARRSKLSDSQQEEVRRKLQMPLEYQGELSRYTWALCLTEALDRDQLRALKVHFKKTVERLWEAQPSHGIAEEQARAIFEGEWATFEQRCRSRFEKTTKTRRQLAEEVCMLFNHVLRQHRHGDEDLQVVELVPAAALLGEEEPLSRWQPALVAREFLEVRNSKLLADCCSAAQRGDAGGAPVSNRWTAMGHPSSDEGRLEQLVVPEMLRRLGPALSFELPPAVGAARMPSEESLLEAARRLNEALAIEESRYLSQLGVRLRGGRVALLNAAHMCLRRSLLDALTSAETERVDRQWRTLQSHRQHTEEEFMAMAHRRAGDASRARTLADRFFDALAREWLDESLVGVAADIRGQCLADMPDASGAAEHAYQQAFVERNWDEVIEYVLDVNAYLHKIFTQLFEERRAAITRAQLPHIAGQLGALFDALLAAAQRWGHRADGGRSKLSAFQDTLRALAAESRATAVADGSGGGPAAADAKQRWQQPWPLLSERFPVLADFEVEEPSKFVEELRVHVASLLQEPGLESLVSAKLEAALLKQQQQVWALVRGCCATCPCCGSKCDRIDVHTVHRCSHHLLPAFNGWRVAGTCEAALDTCKSQKNHEAPKRSDVSDHLYQNLEEYLKAEHPEWLPFPKEERELLAAGALKAAWVNCREPLLMRYDMVDCTPAEWIAAYEEPQRKLRVGAIERAEERLRPYGYVPEVDSEDAA